MQVTINFQQRCLAIQAHLSHAGTVEEKMFSLPFRSLRGSILLDDSRVSLLFTARQPPKVFQQPPEADQGTLASLLRSLVRDDGKVKLVCIINRSWGTHRGFFARQQYLGSLLVIQDQAQAKRL